MKKATITAKGASVKQWSDLMLELNLMKKAWHRYGVTLNIQAPGIKKIIAWGTKKYNLPVCIFRCLSVFVFFHPIILKW